MYYVYILKSKQSDQVYTGLTTDLNKRLIDHNNGKSKHTSKYRPWELAYYSAFASEKRAREFENYLKTGSGIAFTRKRLL